MLGYCLFYNLKYDMHVGYLKYDDRYACRLNIIIHGIQINKYYHSCHPNSTYSSARAEPSAILTREFQLSGLLYSSERWSRSWSDPFLWKSYTSKCCPCSIQYPTSSFRFGWCNFEILETSSAKSSDDWNGITVLSNFLMART